MGVYVGLVGVYVGSSNGPVWVAERVEVGRGKRYSVNRSFMDDSQTIHDPRLVHSLTPTMYHVAQT